MKKYQDYIIKRGKFLGKFEDMYQNCPNPWRQSEIFELNYQMILFLLSLYRVNPKKIADLGCGLGYFTAGIKKSYPSSSVLAADISATAIGKAGKKFGKLGINWRQMDISKSALDGKYDLIIMSQLMWYILPQFKPVLARLVRNNLNKNGYLLVNQSFPQPREQKYGKKYAQNLNDILKMSPPEACGCGGNESI